MTDQNEIPTQSDAELDDVEGHGLKEAAAVAGIGAAALGVGGVAMAATASSHGIGPQNPAIVQQTDRDANQLVSDAAQGSRDLTTQMLADTSALTRDTVTQVKSITAPEVHLATNAATAATQLADRTVTDATTLADHTEGTVLHTAGRVVQSTIQVVKATEDRVGRGWTLDLSVLGMHAQTGGNMLAPDGTVRVFNTNGVEIASAQVINGAATIHVDTVGQNETLTIQYGGNPLYGPSHLPYLMPF